MVTTTYPGLVSNAKNPKMGFLPEVAVSYLDEKTFSSGTPTRTFNFLKDKDM